MPETDTAAHEDLERFARDALAEVENARNVGPLVGRRDEADDLVSLLFESDKPGYPGWKWVVTVAMVGGAPTVVESELMPGDGALLAPEWVPWSERLEEWRAAQAASGATDGDAAAGVADDDAADDDSAEDDDADLDDDDSDLDDDDDDDDDDDVDGADLDDDEEDDLDVDDEDEAYDGIDMDVLADDLPTPPHSSLE